MKITYVLNVVRSTAKLGYNELYRTGLILDRYNRDIVIDVRAYIAKQPLENKIFFIPVC